MSRQEIIDRLQKERPVVLPSMLQCDFGRLDEEIKTLANAGARGLHMDVMDGQFVPNFTYGMPIVEATRRATSMPIDVHLMIAQPETYAEAFIKAGADLITFHAEATPKASQLLDTIRNHDIATGVAINPDTPWEEIKELLPLCDLILVMSVKAGFGGQEFQERVLEKVRQIRATAGDRLLIEIDGGINRQTIGKCAEAGVDLFVVGSAIFKAESYAAELHELTSLAKQHEVNRN